MYRYFCTKYQTKYDMSFDKFKLTNARIFFFFFYNFPNLIFFHSFHLTSPKPMCLGLSDTIMYKCIYVYIVRSLLLYSQVLSLFKNSFSIANLIFRNIYDIISVLFFEMYNKNWKCQKIQYKCCYGGCMLPFGFSVIVIDMYCKFSCKKFLQKCQKMS